MADEVTIKNIEEINRSANWARESTLLRLEKLTEEQTEYLAKMAQETRKQAKQNVQSANNTAGANKKLEQASEDAAEAVDDVADALEKLAREEDRRNRRKRAQEYRDYQNIQSGVGNLRASMQKLERATPADMFSSFTDKMAVAGGRLTDLGGSSARAGQALTLFSRALTVASFSFGALTAITDPYRGMVESGLLFEGSAVKFAKAAYDSGLGLQSFAKTATQYSQSIAATGGGEAFSQSIKNVRDAAQQFGYFGMGMEELADAQARYREGLRSTGILALSNVEDLDKRTIPYLQNLTALSVLYGKQRKDIEAEQEQARRAAQVQAIFTEIALREGPEESERIKAQFDEAVTKMSPLAAQSALVQQYYGGGPSKLEAKVLGPSGLQEYLPRFGGSDEEARAGFERYRQRAAYMSPDIVRQYGMSAAYGGGLAEATPYLLDIVNRGLPGIRGPRATQQAADVQGVRDGRIIDRTTERTLTAQIAAAETINNLKSAALGAADALGLLRVVAEAAAGVAGAGAGATGFLSGIAGTTGGALALVGAAGIGYIAKSLFTSAVVRSVIGTAIPAMSRFLPPLTPAIGTGSGIGLMGGLGRTVAGGGLALGGMAAGAAASGLGAASWLSGALSGAGTGAGIGMMAGPKGAAIGALLGALVGGVSGYLTTPQGAEPAAIGGDFGAGLSALNATIAQGNTEIVFWLKSIDSKMNSVDTGVRRAGGAISAMGG